MCAVHGMRACVHTKKYYFILYKIRTIQFMIKKNTFRK